MDFIWRKRRILMRRLRSRHGFPARSTDASKSARSGSFPELSDEMSNYAMPID